MKSAMINDYRILKAGDEFALDGIIDERFVVDRVETVTDKFETEWDRTIYLIDGRWFHYDYSAFGKYRKFRITSRNNQSDILKFDWCYTEEELDRMAKSEYEYQQKRESIKSGLAKLTDDERALGILDSLIESSA